MVPTKMLIWFTDELMKTGMASFPILATPGWLGWNSGPHHHSLFPEPRHLDQELEESAQDHADGDAHRWGSAGARD